jgi:hypothetical protein
MKHATRMRALKSLLLGGAALALIGLQPTTAQERSQMPGGQGPAASQPQGGNQPSAREKSNQPAQSQRSQERGTTGQGSPSTSQSESQKSDSPSATQDRGRDAQTPKAAPKSDRRQTQDRERVRDNQAQPRDADRDRNQAQDRDTKRDRDQARERDSKRDRDQARERDTKRDRDQARDRDGDRARDRDQARDRDGDRTRDRDQARDTDRSRASDRQVSEQQRTRISTSIRQANVQPVRNVNFSVSVGAVVPASVHFYPVTPAIVEIYPEYRGYQFVVVEEDILIVEPRTRKIVTVIDNGGGRAATRSRSKLTLTEKQRDVIRRNAVQRRTTGSARTTTIEEYEIGDDIPETVEIETFPDTIYTEVPEIRSYRYVVRDDDIYVIDPSERRVIEIIR